MTEYAACKRFLSFTRMGVDGVDSCVLWIPPCYDPDLSVGKWAFEHT